MSRLNESDVRKIADDLTTSLALAAVAQDKLNQQLAADWKDKGWDYPRAFAKEATEILDHTKWEWWKHKDQTPDEQAWGNILIELGDMLCFAMSDLLVKAGGSQVWLSNNLYQFAEEWVRTNDEMPESYRQNIAALDRPIAQIVMSSLGHKRIFLLHFAELISVANVSLPELLVYFFGKVSLNTFRWANGYKEKTYKKLWAGSDGSEVEDNEYLRQYLRNLIAQHGAVYILDLVYNGTFEHDISRWLRAQYDMHAL